MKKIFAGILVAAVLTSCAGCVDVEVPGAEQKLSVITTIYPAYDFARQVFGDTAEVTLLLKPGTESHTYDPSAKDIVNINNCDLFIYNGGESDQWVSSILDGAGDINTLRMMDVVELREEEHTEGMQAEHDHDDEHEEDVYDEHIWTSPRNAIDIVAAVAAKACAISPENSELYDQASGDYITQMLSLAVSFDALLADEERYFIFGDRFPLLYFFEEYDLNYYAAFPGCGSNVEPSAQTISFLLDKLAGDDVVPAVFTIELSSGRIAATLAEDSGLDVYEFHTCHNITADDFAAGETYVTLMERNYETLKNILA